MSHVKKAEALLQEIESAYTVSLPERYKSFILNKEFEKYPSVEFTGFIKGPYNMDFMDPDLADVEQLGMSVGITDMSDCPWEDSYSNFIPLACLSHPKLVDGAKGFLVLDIKTKGNPVLLFDYEGWTLYPIDNSFETFLKSIPNLANDTKTSFRP